MSKNDHLRIFNIKINEKIFAFLVFIVFLAVNWDISGPQYMSDEIGYLAKASAIAGHYIDRPTHWYPGYSFILAPLFYIFSDPGLVWKGVLVVNALMWGISFFCLFHIILELFPNASQKRIYASLTICAFYPAWITMSGYAFATTAFTFFFMLIIFALTRYVQDNSSMKWPLISAFATGFITWIHPVGLGVIFAYCVVLCLGRAKICRVFLLQITIAVAMFVLFKLLVDPWVTARTVITGEFKYSDYMGIKEALYKFVTFPGLYKCIPYFFAPYLYFVVSTFGVVNYFMFHVFKRAKEVRHYRNNITPHDFLLAFILLAFCFPFLSTVIENVVYLTTPSSPSIHINHIFHGRYPEMFFLPVLGIALMSFQVDRKLLLNIFILILLSLSLLTPWIEITPHLNWVNTQAYWPAILLNGFNPNPPFRFVALSIVVISIFYLLLRYIGIKAFLLVLLINLYSVCFLQRMHKVAFVDFAAKSDLVSFIRANFPADTAIVYDRLSLNVGYQYLLYTFELFNYDFLPGSLEKWLLDDSELFITGFPEKIDQRKNTILAYIPRYNLYLIHKEKISTFDNLVYPPHSNNPYTRVVYPKSPLDPLFAQVSSDIKLKFASTFYSFVGKQAGTSLVSTNKGGGLMFGPYDPITAGEYEFILFGKINNVNAAYTDVFSSEAGNIQFYKFDISADSNYSKEETYPGLNLVLPASNVIQRFKFSMSDDVKDINFRVYVGEEDNIQLDGYIVRKLDVVE